MSDKIRDAVQHLVVDALTAADLVRSGHRSKALSDRLSQHCSVLSKMLAAVPAAPVAQEPVDNDAFAAALAEKVIAYIRGAGRLGRDWRPGLAGMIARRTSRLTAPPTAEQPTGTTSDQYRAELYDEVWEEAHALGFGNVTEALSALARLKAAEQPDTVAVPRELLGEAESIIESYAEALKASHAPGGDWEGEEAAHDEYELEEGVASKLRALLRGGEA